MTDDHAGANTPDNCSDDAADETANGRASAHVDERALFALIEQLATEDSGALPPVERRGDTREVGESAERARRTDSGDEPEMWLANTRAALLAALAQARAQGGEPLADALLASVSDERTDLLMDTLLDITDTGQREQPNQRARYANPSPSISPIPGSDRPALSSGVRRALTLIFGRPQADDRRGDYAQRTPPSISRVAEEPEAYQADAPRGQRESETPTNTEHE